MCQSTEVLTRQELARIWLGITFMGILLFPGSCRQDLPFLPLENIFPDTLYTDTLPITAWNTNLPAFPNRDYGTLPLGYYRGSRGTYLAYLAFEVAPPQNVQIPIQAQCIAAWIALPISRIEGDLDSLFPVHLATLTERLTPTVTPADTPITSQPQPYTATRQNNILTIPLPTWQGQTYLDLLLAGYTTLEEWLAVMPGFLLMPDTTSLTVTDTLQIWYVILASTQAGLYLVYQHDTTVDTILLPASQSGLRHTAFFRIYDNNAPHSRAVALADSIHGDDTLYLTGWNRTGFLLQLPCNPAATTQLDVYIPLYTINLEQLNATNPQLAVLIRSNNQLLTPDETILNQFTTSETTNSCPKTQGKPHQCHILHLPYTYLQQFTQNPANTCPQLLIYPKTTSQTLSFHYTRQEEITVIRRSIPP